MKEKRTALKSPDNFNKQTTMRKLHLASFKFKVGDNELEELRLVASYGADHDTVLTDAILFWAREAEGTDRVMTACRISPTLTETDRTVSKVETPKPGRDYLQNLLHDFFNSRSDMSPLEATQQENLENEWKRWIWEAQENKESAVHLIKDNEIFYLFGDKSATGPMDPKELSDHLYEEIRTGNLVMIQR